MEPHELDLLNMNTEIPVFTVEIKDLDLEQAKDIATWVRDNILSMHKLVFTSIHNDVRISVVLNSETDVSLLCLTWSHFHPKTEVVYK